MQPIVFISRELTEQSVFLQQLQAAGFKVVGESLIEFKAVPFSKIPFTDWVFFYSKQSVKYFFEGLRQAGLKLDAKLAVFGKGTAKALEKELYQADFIGTGKPEVNANYFLMLAKGQQVLFPRAANSLLTIQRLLKDQIETFDLIVYQNQPRRNFDLPNCNWLVFTSPLNAEAYFAKYPINPAQKVLAIGVTTAKTLQQLGVPNVKIAEEPSEMALAQVIRGTIPL